MPGLSVSNSIMGILEVTWEWGGDTKRNRTHFTDAFSVQFPLLASKRSLLFRFSGERQKGIDDIVRVLTPSSL